MLLLFLCCIFSFYNCEYAGERHGNDSQGSSMFICCKSSSLQCLCTPTESLLSAGTRNVSHVFEPHRCQWGLLVLGNCWGRFLPRNRLELPIFYRRELWLTCYQQLSFWASFGAAPDAQKIIIAFWRTNLSQSIPLYSLLKPIPNHWRAHG